MLLPLHTVDLLSGVKLLVHLSDPHLNHARVVHSDVVICTPRYFLAEVLQPLGRGPQLTHLLYFKPFRLLPHVFEEDGEVRRDSVRSLEVFGVFTRVELLAQVDAHFFNFFDRRGELHVRFDGIFVADGAQDIKLFLLPPVVGLFFTFFNLNSLLRLNVGKSLQLLDFLFEAT